MNYGGVCRTAPATPGLLTSLRIIYQEDYTDYESTCKLAGLLTLFQRRDDRSLNFARRCTENKELSRFFPRVPVLPQQQLREREKFVVNFSHGSKYQNSAIVYCQKQLNTYYSDENKKRKAGEEEKERRWQDWMAELDERLRRRRAGQDGQGSGQEGGQGQEGGLEDQEGGLEGQEDGLDGQGDGLEGQEDGLEGQEDGLEGGGLEQT